MSPEFWFVVKWKRWNAFTGFNSHGKSGAGMVLASAWCVRMFNSIWESYGMRLLLVLFSVRIVLLASLFIFLTFPRTSNSEFDTWRSQVCQSWRCYIIVTHAKQSRFDLIFIYNEQMFTSIFLYLGASPQVIQAVIRASSPGLLQSVPGCSCCLVQAAHSTHGFSVALSSAWSIHSKLEQHEYWCLLTPGAFC